MYSKSKKSKYSFKNIEKCQLAINFEGGLKKPSIEENNCILVPFSDFRKRSELNFISLIAEKTKSF